MNRRRSCPALPTCRGATLTEVLMSLLVMGLGISSVFTLFPLSIVRSVKATNNTNGALTAENARELVLSGVVAMTPDAMLPALPNNPPPMTAYQSYKGTYVVDPYGVKSISNLFGNGGAANQQLPRRSPWPAAVTLQTLDRLIAGHDSWITAVAPQIPAAVDPAGRYIDFPAGTDLSAIGSNSQVVIYSADRKLSAARRISPPAVGSSRVTLLGGSPVEPDIPTAIVNSFGEARVETFERRYTWLLTVDSDGFDHFKLHCAVFFRRPMSDEPETVYAVTPATSGDLRRIDVALPTRPSTAIKAGQYVFGIYQTAEGASTLTWGQWYRIVAVEDDGTIGNVATLVLDSPWRGPGTQPALMFLQGVVGVFDL